MAQQKLDVGTAPDALDGDDLRAANQKINANFDDLYQLTGSLPTNRGQGGLYGLDANLFGMPSMQIRSVTLSASAYTANRIYMTPWLLRFPITLQKVRVNGSNSSGAADVRLGIVKAKEDGTSSSLVWSGSVNVPLTSAADRDISSINVNLEPGLYYLISKSDNANTTMNEVMALSPYCKFASGANSFFFKMYVAGSSGVFADPVLDPTNVIFGANAANGMGLPFVMQWDSRAQDWA